MSKRSKKQNNSGGIFKFLVILIIAGVFLYNRYGTEINEYVNKITDTTKTDVSVPSKESTNLTTTDDTGDLVVRFIDVGQADSILVSDDNENMLIDAGNNEDGPKLVNYFKSLNITDFKYVVGTHAHEDHIGGMDDIINNFNIGTFYMPDAYTTTKTFEDVLDALEKKNMKLDTPKIGSTFNLGKAVITVLYIGTDKKNLNDTSIVLKLNYEANSILFMGDATSNVEKQIMNKDLKSDILKVGHHGSQYSTTESFLKKVDPKYAVIEVGKNNSYNHPNKVTLDKLAKYDVKVYRTDEDGTIIATSDGNNFTFKEEKTDTNG